MHHYCYTSQPVHLPNNTLYNHHFLFHLILSTAIHWHPEQTRHSFAFPFSNSPICPLDSGSLRSMFQSCSCDVPSALCTPSCCNACMTFPLEPYSPGDATGGVVYLRIILSPEEASHIYDTSVWEKDYPGKVVMWQFIHLRSTSQYNSRSNHSGNACCYTNLNHLEHHLLCASSRYWWYCFQHQFWFLSSSDAYPLTSPAREALPVATLLLV